MTVSQPKMINIIAMALQVNEHTGHVTEELPV